MISTCCTSGYRGPKYRPAGFLSLWCLHTLIRSSGDCRPSTPGRKIVLTQISQWFICYLLHSKGNYNQYKFTAAKVYPLHCQHLYWPYIVRVLHTLAEANWIKLNQSEENLNNSNWEFEKDEQLSDSSSSDRTKRRCFCGSL